MLARCWGLGILVAAMLAAESHGQGFPEPARAARRSQTRDAASMSLARPSRERDETRLGREPPPGWPEESDRLVGSPLRHAGSLEGLRREGVDFRAGEAWRRKLTRERVVLERPQDRPTRDALPAPLRTER